MSKAKNLRDAEDALAEKLDSECATCDTIILKGIYCQQCEWYWNDVDAHIDDFDMCEYEYGC